MTQEKQPTFDIVRIYTKNVSLESPNTPEVFKLNVQPEIQIQLGNDHREVDPNIHEVLLRVTVTATYKVEDAEGDEAETKVMFLAEVEQAGLFLIDGFEEAQEAHLKGAYCPNILYPYIRPALDHLISGAGFPPVMLSPINFEAVYADRLAQQAEEAAEEQVDA
ncbi:protein-export protein SecB [Ignatzschineria indica]|uniref:Protein-export protein SecB n=1 Tax=Ignatzschineria indica TaxID=472583 RepID=A0A2U2AHV8_9GAMM|nr:protein-export chaperone SecB [Ignatzschineria indica]PWD82245.1 protein-export chaperone SecB [Ignatzschineria indica]GGZ87800.1 protein-export protein SecB [Ignatzschineria indica]